MILSSYCEILLLLFFVFKMIGVFKNPEKIDAFVDLKGVASLSSVEVSNMHCATTHEQPLLVIGS